MFDYIERFYNRQTGHSYRAACRQVVMPDRDQANLTEPSVKTGGRPKRPRLLGLSLSEGLGFTGDVPVACLTRL